MRLLGMLWGREWGMISIHHTVKRNTSQLFLWSCGCWQQVWGMIIGQPVGTCGNGSTLSSSTG